MCGHLNVSQSWIRYILYIRFFIIIILCTSGKLTAIGKKRMEGKGKGVEGALKKRRRVLSGVSLLPQSSSGKEALPPPPSPVVTISREAPNPPAAIPLNRSVVDKPPVTSVSLDSKDTEGGVSTYYTNPPAIGYDSSLGPITPENGVEFLCSYGKNMLKSREANIFGKMSTVDRIRQSTGNLWQVIYSLFVYSRVYFFKVIDLGVVTLWMAGRGGPSGHGEKV